MDLSKELNISDHKHGRVTEKSLKHGSWTISTRQTITNLPPYWQYGKEVPRFAVTDRQIIFAEDNSEATDFIYVSAPYAFYLQRWSGDFVANAAYALGLNHRYPQTEEIKGLSSLVLNPAYQLETHRKAGLVTIYKRTFLGEKIDYVAKDSFSSENFHAETQAAALRGLRAKISGGTGQGILKDIVNLERALKLGLCKPGIQSFCEDLQIDIQGSYTIVNLAAKLKRAPEIVSKYRSDLWRLARAYNSKELNRLL